jgi:hypothetical protein
LGAVWLAGFQALLAFCLLFRWMIVLGGWL